MTKYGASRTGGGWEVRAARAIWEGWERWEGWELWEGWEWWTLSKSLDFDKVW